MYFLEKLCRICVRSGASLVDINTVDFDLVKLSEKLDICANLDISNDVISSEICEKCVNKLRVSYHFLDMCKKSTKKLQGFIDKLTESNGTTAQKCELNIDIDKLQTTEQFTVEQSTVHTCKSNKINWRNSGRRKQRITKVQRCSLLQQILNKPKKERDKSCLQKKTFDYSKGGLKDIIDFTQNYEFSFNLDKNCNIEIAPLDKLTAFSKNYFTRDFSEFKNHILYIIENQEQFDSDECSWSESELNTTSRDDSSEEIMVEPDIKVKREINDDFEDEGSDCPLDYLETSFEEDLDTKMKEEPLECETESQSMTSGVSPLPPIKQEDSNTDFVPELDISNSLDSSPAVKLLDKLVSSYPIDSRKVFSPSSVKCRTRDQPYINPILKNQFLYRSFKCDRCNRYFKSQGYLKAHTSKVH